MKTVYTIFIFLLATCFLPGILTAQIKEVQFEVDSNGNLLIDHEIVSLKSTQIEYWSQLFGETPRRIPEQKRVIPGHFRPAYYIFDSSGVVINFQVETDSSELITNIYFNLSKQAYYQPKVLFTDKIIIFGSPVDFNTGYKELQLSNPIKQVAVRRKNGKPTTNSIRIYLGERSLYFRNDKQTGKISEIGYREYKSLALNPAYNH